MYAPAIKIKSTHHTFGLVTLTVMIKLLLDVSVQK